jgi:pyrroline-5-carboxylate reductase
MMPPDPQVRSLLERFGTVVEVPDPDAFDALAAASGIMATHFAMAATVSSWLEGRGVEASDARGYVGRILSGLARTADGAATTGYAELVGQHETRGGLNEQLRTHMADCGEFDALGDGLDGLYRRIRGGTASEG